MLIENPKSKSYFVSKVERLGKSIDLQERKQEDPFISTFRKKELLVSFRSRQEKFYNSLSEEYKEKFKQSKEFERLTALLVRGKLEPII